MLLSEIVKNQREWSLKTFGPGRNTKGLIDHIKKELEEIAADPTDIEEWADVVILAMDGAWRAGYDPVEVSLAVQNKQAINRDERQWPDWRTAEPGKAIEHIRGHLPV